MIIAIISSLITADKVEVATATKINPTSPLGAIPIPITEVFIPFPIAPIAETYLPIKARKLINNPIKNTSKDARIVMFTSEPI